MATRVNLNTPLAKTIERRLLKTLQNSEHRQLRFADLVQDAKCDRWWELSKHVVGYMEYCRLINVNFDNVELVMTGENNFADHLDTLQHRVQAELLQIKALIQRQKTADRLEWPKGYRACGIIS